MKKNNTINLSKKHLKELPEELFRFKQEVRVLKLYGNQLTSLTSRIAEFENLEELYLGKNRIDSLPKEIGNLKKLKILSVQYNNLIFIPDEIGDLENLEQLWLSQNKLTHIPKEIGSLKKLINLKLNNNFLVEIPIEIGKCEHLKFLYLNRNHLKELPESFSELSNLKEIYLSTAGPLIVVPETFCKLRYLELIEIDYQVQLPPCMVVHQTSRVKILITE